MIKSKGIFAVSFIAMMVVGGAYANIASQGYVDQQIDTRQVAGDYATNTALGSVRTTATNAQSAATAAKTAADEAADAADAAASAAATAQKTANAKVSTAQGPSAANKAVITNSSGSITTGTISSGMIANDAVTSAKIDDGTIVNADIASNAAIAASKISGLATVATSGSYNDLSNKPTIPAAITVDSALSSTSTNPVQNKVINTALAGKLSTTGTAAKATADANGNEITKTYATKTEVGSKLSSISGSTGGTGNVVTSVSASGSTVSATKGITAEETKNKVKSVRAVASATDTAYPSEKAVATALATKADASALSGYATTSELNAVEDKAEAAQTAANSKVATAQGPSAANKAVITNSSGSITTGTISSGMIANDAVTSAKIDDGTIVNADIASNAAIAASKISGLATVATSGSYNDLANKPTIPAAYVLKAATTDALGGVKSGGDIAVASTGAVTVSHATKADTATSATTAASATKATQDGNGANIADTYAKKTELPTVNNATLTIQKNGTNVATFTANSANAATANITVPTKTSELTNDSNYATTAQVNARVATAQGTNNANDVMVVNSSGNVTPALITNANISSSAAIAQSKISGLTDALAGKLSTTGTAAKATADAKGNNIADTYATKSQINALDSTSTGTGAVVTGVSQKDGKVSVTKGNVQIPVGSATATTYATIWVQ